MDMFWERKIAVKLIIRERERVVERERGNVHSTVAGFVI